MSSEPERSTWTIQPGSRTIPNFRDLIGRPPSVCILVFFGMPHAKQRSFKRADVSRCDVRTGLVRVSLPISGPERYWF